MNNSRRTLVALIAGALTAPFGGFAQTPALGMQRIGFLGITSAADTEARLDALRTGLRNLGYAEGKNIAIEYRFAEGKYERLGELAAELASLKVDVIVTYSNIAARAAKQVTTTIPIVVATSADLVITASLAATVHWLMLTDATFTQFGLPSCGHPPAAGYAALLTAAGRTPMPGLAEIHCKTMVRYAAS